MSVSSLYRYYHKGKSNGHLLMVIPKPYSPDEDNPIRPKTKVREIRDTMGEQFYMKPDVYDHKEYPTCQCGRKYVPINKSDKKCFFCLFTDK